MYFTIKIKIQFTALALVFFAGSFYSQPADKKTETYKSPEIKWGFTGNIPSGETDFMTSSVASGRFWSVSTQPHQPNWPNPSRIWAAATLYSDSGPDSCRFFYSDNGGQSWTYTYYFVFSPIVDFRPGELDIELVYDGTAVWIYGTAGYNNVPINRTISMFFRINTAANTFFSGDLFFPGFFTTTNIYYNPRITSDNSVYGAASKIMFTCSFDSSNGEDHYVTSKFCKITNPFAASPTLTTSMPNQGRFFYFNFPAPPNTYLWTDIAYTKAGANDRTIIVYNCTDPAANSINLQWSDDYGASVTGSVILPETQPNYGAKIAFNGGAVNFTGMIAYVRQTSGSNWDANSYSTTNGGINWLSGVIDNTPGRIRSVDIISLVNVNNKFKIAYTQDSSIGTIGFYTGGSPGVFNQPSKLMVSTSAVDTSNAKIIAGYRSNISDDCIALFSKTTGQDILASRLCQSTVGISNNGIQPAEFSLQQNYPNPFNPVTNIKFSIPVSSFVRLTVYDVSGREIESLVNSNLEAGIYSYDFKGEGLASGIYFYAIKTPEFSETKKMILIK